MDTNGFYKNDNGQLLHGPTTVQFPISIDHVDLNRDQKDDHSYPVDGWHWFDTEEEARIFFDIPLEIPEPPPSYDWESPFPYDWEPPSINN